MDLDIRWRSAGGRALTQTYDLSADEGETDNAH